MEFQRFYDSCGKSRSNCESSEKESSVCIICCNSFTGVVNSNEKRSLGSCLKLLFGKLGSEVGLDSLKTCAKCSLLLESYGKIHHQWKILELQLQWRVEELSNSMQAADKTPNSLESFKTWCDNLDSRDQDQEGTKLIQLRTKLSGECMKLKAKFSPWVRLERIDKNKTALVNRRLHNPDQKALLLGWLNSLVTVAILSDFNPEETCKNYQLEDFPVEEKLQIISPLMSSVEPNKSRSITRTAKRVRKQCKVCESFFCSVSSLRRHMGRFHPDKHGASSNKTLGHKLVYKCYKCSSLFSTSDKLRRHLSRQHEGCPFKVVLQHVKRDPGMPSKRWANNSTTGNVLKSSLVQSSQNKHCGICKIFFYKESTLSWHMETFHANDKPSVTSNENRLIILYNEDFRCSFPSAV